MPAASNYCLVWKLKFTNTFQKLVENGHVIFQWQYINTVSIFRSFPCGCKLYMLLRNPVVIVTYRNLKFWAKFAIRIINAVQISNSVHENWKPLEQGSAVFTLITPGFWLSPDYISINSFRNSSSIFFYQRKLIKKNFSK